jgi:hypothetical protein
MLRAAVANDLGDPALMQSVRRWRERERERAKHRAGKTPRDGRAEMGVERRPQEEP